MPQRRTGAATRLPKGRVGGVVCDGAWVMCEALVEHIPPAPPISWLAPVMLWLAPPIMFAPAMCAPLVMWPPPIIWANPLAAKTVTAATRIRTLVFFILSFTFFCLSSDSRHFRFVLLIELLPLYAAEAATPQIYFEESGSVCPRCKTTVTCVRQPGFDIVFQVV